MSCFGAEPGQAQQGSGEASGEGLALMQSQVRFNRVPGSLGAKPDQVQQGSGEEKVRDALVQSQVKFNTVPKRFRRRFWRRSGRLWCRARSG